MRISTSPCGSTRRFCAHTRGHRAIRSRAVSGRPSPEILAAMAAGVPVVTTSAGVEGIRARPGRDRFVEDEEAGLGRRLVELIRDPELRGSIAASALSLLESRYSWDSAVERIAALVAEVGATSPAPRTAPRPANPLAAAASVS